MARPRRRPLMPMALLGALLLAAAGYASGAYQHALTATGHGGELTIEPGANLPDVARQLQAAGLIREARAFALLARRRGLDRALKAGTYEFAPGLDAAGILEQLASGKVATRRLTVPEGLRLEQVAERVAAAGFGPADEFLRLCRAEADGFGLEGLPAGATLEGYLFPETYYLPRSAGLRELLEAMVARFVAVWREVGGPAVRPRHEVVIVASLVEREAKLDEERPKVAGVIENRLRDGWKLEFCSTVIYALGEPRERLLYRDLRVRSPYNTYLHGGLPPGPICSPGRASLAAAVRPARHDYRFFVLDEQGRHLFSRTGAEHNRARGVAGSQKGR